MKGGSRIEVTALGFDHDMQPYPRRIELEGTVYCFVGAGKQTIITSGTLVARFYRMTDGTRSYHLKNERDNWILLNM